MEDTIFRFRMSQYVVEMVTVGVGDEYLSVVVVSHEPDDLLHPVRIEFVKHAVEK